MESEARCVLGKHARLDGPDPAGIGTRDHRLHEGATDSPPARAGGDVDGVLGDSGVARARRCRREGDPAHDPAVLDGDEAVLGVVARVERATVGRLRLERGGARRDALDVDRLDGGPVRSEHRADLGHGLHIRLAAWSAGRRSTATARSWTGTRGSEPSSSSSSASSVRTIFSSATTSSSPRSRPSSPGLSYREVLTIALERLASDEGLTLPEGETSALARSLPSWPVFDDVRPGLEEARNRGWNLSILSNTDRDLIDASMVSIGIAFKLVVVAGEIGSYKPAPKHWEVFREKSHADPAHHVHVAPEPLPRHRAGVGARPADDLDQPARRASRPASDADAHGRRRPRRRARLARSRERLNVLAPRALPELPHVHRGRTRRGL